MFEFDSRIRYSECAQDGKLSLAGVVNYFQDCAVFHSSDVGRGPATWKAEHYAWMLASWQIVVERYPKMNEIVRTRTQAYNFHGFEADRNFLMWDKKGELLAFANSRWIYFDTEAGRPIRIPKLEVEAYGVDPEFEMEKAPRHIKMPSEGVVDKQLFKVRATNLDTNGHVNNEQYISMALAYLPAGIKVRELRVEYLSQAYLGDILAPRVYHDTEGYIVRLDMDGKVCAVMQFTL
jgi:acyl-ACP thioesterase